MSTKYQAIVLGATGNVGGRIVRLLVRSPQCGKVIVVTRRHTDAFAKDFEKVRQIVVPDMDEMESTLSGQINGVDVALAAFGVGKGTRQMPAAEVRKIEVEYPAAFCRAAKAGGAKVCGMMTALGADPESSVRYLRIMGDKERAVAAAGIDFLGLYRPGVILGNSNTPGIYDRLMPAVDWMLPSKYRSIHKNDVARAIVARSEQALAAGEKGLKILEYGDMEPYFVKGDHD